MAKSQKPKVNSKPVASQYEGVNERIIEFEGGLISFIQLDNGKIKVDLYNLDRTVEVAVSWETDYNPKIVRSVHGVTLSNSK